MVEPIQAVVFDAYGTLFDVHSVIRRCERLFPARGESLSQLWRSKQLEYTWLRSLMGRYEDFESVTRAALNYACGSLALALDDPTRQSLMEEYRHLSPYPEVSSALQSLAGRKLAILSNGSPDMLRAVVRNAGFEPLFHAVLSVDLVRVFKPHPRVYQLAVDQLGVPREGIVFVSSNYWDASGATSFGFRTFWINRARAQADALGYAPHCSLKSLDELSQALVAS